MIGGQTGDSTDYALDRFLSEYPEAFGSKRVLVVVNGEFGRAMKGEIAQYNLVQSGLRAQRVTL